jgi:hypothetical protein
MTIFSYTKNILKGEGKQILEFFNHQRRKIIRADFVVLQSATEKSLYLNLTLEPFEDEDLIDYIVSVPVSLKSLESIEISDSNERAAIEM